MFISLGAAAPPCVCAAFELIPSYGLRVQRRKEVAAGGGAAGCSRHPPNCHTSKQGGAPPPTPPTTHFVNVSAGETGAAACESVPGFPRVCAEQMAHSDMAE